MRLIINISEKDYEYAKQIAPTRNKAVYCERLIIATSNGIPISDVETELESEKDGE